MLSNSALLRDSAAMHRFRKMPKRTHGVVRPKRYGSPNGNPNLSGIAAANREAWDSLYGKTDALVWGKEPIGFLPDFMPELAGELDASSRVLDAATGEGRNLELLLSIGAQVFACDSSPHALGKIPEDVRQNIKSVTCRLEALPFEDCYFDFVLATDIIETLPEPDTMLKEVNRVLRPGGRLLCNIPGMEDEISAVDMKPLGHNRFLFQEHYFYQFYSESEAVALLNASGFRVLRNEVCRWEEGSHPEFRGTSHTHTSRVFLVEKMS